MKPYFVWHNQGIAFGFGIGRVAPVGQLDISISLGLFTIGLRQKYEVTQEEVDKFVENYIQEWDEKHEHFK